MSDFYPNYHNHDDDVPVLAEKGQKGMTGEKGRSGQDGRVTQIIYAFADRPPTDLKGAIIAKDWEKEGSPVQMIQMKQGQSVVYTVDGSIWTYLPGCNSKGWIQTGLINTAIYTEPGVKGDTGDKGAAAPKGEKGPEGPQGLTGGKGEPGVNGDKGDRGERGFPGTKGDPGDRGPEGLSGSDGDKGDKGEPGESGVNGLDGRKGEPGLAGLKGEAGAAGRDGVVPKAEALPVMLGSYDGRIGTLRSHFNVESVTRVDTGHYRFRLEDKNLNSSETIAFANVVLTLSDFAEGPTPAVLVGRMTDRVVSVYVRNPLTGDAVDAWVNVALFNPN
jgi:hypothetical protein